MHKILLITESVTGVFLIAAILLQQKGTGLSGIFGGDGGGFYQTKRGFEKFLFYSTIVLAAVFFGSALLSLVY